VRFKERKPGRKRLPRVRNHVLKRGRHLYAFWDYQKGGQCISKKCLAFVFRLKQHQPMNTKAFICILASAALLVNCTPNTNNTTTAAVRPKPTPRPRPPAGKRTERVGTVTYFDAATITLTSSSGTCSISRSDSCYELRTGTLAVGNTVDIVFCFPASSAPGKPIDKSWPCH
jgi:hypothetical protein